MTNERYKQLDESGLLGKPIFTLTKNEIEEGWHYCYEWDGLLTGPGMDEIDCCHCLPNTHRVYSNRKPI